MREILELLANIGTGKLIVLGIVGIIALFIIFLIITGTAAVLGPGRMAVRGTPARKEAAVEPSKPMPVPTRILGWGIVLSALGLGILVALYLLPEVSILGIVGTGLAFGGGGLVVFYLIASKRERTEEGKTRGEFRRPVEDVLRPLGEEVGRFGRMGRMN